MLLYAVPVTMNHGVLCKANSCETLCVMLSQWFGKIVCYAGQETVNHRVLFGASDCESWCAMRSKLL